MKKVCLFITIPKYDKKDIKNFLEKQRGSLSKEDIYKILDNYIKPEKVKEIHAYFDERFQGDKIEVSEAYKIIAEKYIDDLVLNI